MTTHLDPAGYSSRKFTARRLPGLQVFEVADADPLDPGNLDQARVVASLPGTGDEDGLAVVDQLLGVVDEPGQADVAGRLVHAASSPVGRGGAYGSRTGPLFCSTPSSSTTLRSESLVCSSQWSADRLACSASNSAALRCRCSTPAKATATRSSRVPTMNPIQSSMVPSRFPVQ